MRCFVSFCIVFFVPFALVTALFFYSHFIAQSFHRFSYTQFKLWNNRLILRYIYRFLFFCFALFLFYFYFVSEARKNDNLVKTFHTNKHIVLLLPFSLLLLFCYCSAFVSTFIYICIPNRFCHLFLLSFVINLSTTIKYIHIYSNYEAHVIYISRW